MHYPAEEQPTRAELDAEERQDRLEEWARTAAPDLARNVGVDVELADADDLAWDRDPVTVFADGTVAIYVRLLMDREDLPE